MRTRAIFSALTTLGLLAFVSTASAADLPRQQPVYKAPAAFSPAYNWTGPYAGINGGFGWGSSSWDGFAAGNVDTSGGLIGLTFGYNWQTPASPLVFGVETDIDWSSMRGSFTSAGCPTGCETRNNYFGTFRGRLGYAWDRVMPYITGGLAYGDIHANQTGFGGTSSTRAGWTIGGGVEAAIAGPWTAKLEYLYADLGSVSCAPPACGLPTNANFHTNIIRAGLNYRF